MDNWTDPFYRYVRQNPWTKFDPLGLATHVNAVPSQNGRIALNVTVTQKKYLFFGPSKVTHAYGAISMPETLDADVVRLTLQAGLQDRDTIALFTLAAIAAAELNKRNQENQNQAPSETATPEESRDGKYRPDEPLPRKPNGESQPNVDENGDPVGPHTQIGTQTSRRAGDYTQAREFDAEGKPVKDIDFTDHGRPSQHLDNPHQHPYVPNPTGGTPQRGGDQPLEVVAPELPQPETQTETGQ